MVVHCGIIPLNGSVTVSAAEYKPAREELLERLYIARAMSITKCWDSPRLWICNAAAAAMGDWVSDHAAITREETH